MKNVIVRAGIVFHNSWPAVNVDCDRKFRNFWGSIRAVRRLSDTICIENGLSIVEDPKPHGKRLGDRVKPSHWEQLRVMIDRAQEEKSAVFDALLKLLLEMGCEVSRRGKAIRLKASGWENVARMDDKLGAGYSEEEISSVLAGEKQHTLRKKSIVQSEPPKVSLLVDFPEQAVCGCLDSHKYCLPVCSRIRDNGITTVTFSPFSS